MKIGPVIARVLKLFLHFHLVFSTGITFNYLLQVKLGDFFSVATLKGRLYIKVNFCFPAQKLLPVSESDFILKFLEVKFGLNTTT